MASTRTLTEPDLFRAYWDDGLLDLLSGLALLLTGLGWGTELGPLATIQAPLWIVLWAPLRRRIVEPRAGFVRFSLARQKSTGHGLSWTLAAGVGTFVLMTVVALLAREETARLAIGHLVAGLPAVLVAIAAAIAAALTGARRFYGYGLTLLAGAAATVLLERGPAPPLVVGALVAIVSGAVLLRRFVRAASADEKHS